MGVRGPIPKPDDERQGRNLPIRVTARQETVAVPEPPKGVKQEVKDLWLRLWETPVARAWDPNMDGPLLDRYARTLHHWMNAQRDLGRLEDVITHGSQGQPVLHPLTQYVAQLDDRLMKMEDKLGMSPMARARLGLTIAETERTAAQLNEMVKRRREEK